MNSLLLTVVLLSSPFTPASEPRETVVRLQRAIQSTDEAASARPLLGDALAAAVEAQQAYARACAALAAPDEKPHMLDQSLYLYAPDRPKSVQVGTARVRDGFATVPVQMSVDGYRWSHTVVLQQQGPQWRVLDVRWPEGGSVTERLQAFSRYRCTR